MSSTKHVNIVFFFFFKTLALFVLGFLLIYFGHRDQLCKIQIYQGQVVIFHMWFKVTNKCRGKYFVCAVSVTKMYLHISVNRYTIQALIIITYDKCGAGEKIWTKTTECTHKISMLIFSHSFFCTHIQTHTHRHTCLTHVKAVHLSELS